MPVTSNQSSDNGIQEVDQQICSISNLHVTEESVQTDEMSSATVNSDSVAGTDLNAVVESEVMDNNVHLVSPSDSVPDSFDNEAASFNESAARSSRPALTNVNKGFQDAFAAFASSACEDVKVADMHEHADSPVADNIVSSEDYSNQVSTSEDTLNPMNYESMENNTYSGNTSDINTEAYLQPSQADLAESAQLVESNEPEVSGDSVYFIQTTDASGQVVTSIIDPNDIPSYSNSVVYKQCMRADGEIETTIVHSGNTAVSQEEHENLQQGEQVIYAHDVSGHLIPLDPSLSANDVAPPGKQFIYMQDSTGRIIRAVMDASKTMVPGQQVYYTQSDDGKIITSVMDSANTLEDSSQMLQQTEQMYQQQIDETAFNQHQEANANLGLIDRSSGFNIDNSMSGLSMLAELSHLTAGQATTTIMPGSNLEQHEAVSNSECTNIDEFRPVAMVTRPVGSADDVESCISELKVGDSNTDRVSQSTLVQKDVVGRGESVIDKIVSQITCDQTQASNALVSGDNLFVQWQNLDSMCWMDVVLIMLVYSPTLRSLVDLDPSHELSSTLLITLLKANKQAQLLLQKLLKKNNDNDMNNDIQTGAGNLPSIQDPKTSKLVCKENMDEIGKAINILYAMREKIWQGLQPRLRCERGKHNSPVLVLPLLVREKPEIKQMFTMSYRYVFKCEKCTYMQDDQHTKILPSIPAVPEDFNMKEPCFVRNCFECKAPNQRMMMKFEQLQDFVQMHFVKGLPHSRFDDLSFVFKGDLYEVTAAVHYKNNPDHFIAWVRNAPGPAWMECDDLKSVITCYQLTSPNIPASQVHMVMWERRLTPQHTLVMRDTEDTKLLASLVLTVQQPSSLPPPPPTETELKPGISGTAVATSTTQSLSSTSLLSGLGTQMFSPYASRGKGRGRGGKSTNSSISQAGSTTSIMRRVSPAVTQVLASSAATSSMPTSPQIVRLPLSALTNSGLNLRGSLPGGTRFVLINNSQAGAATSTALNRPGSPRVVVVRSQGGASNFSAAQLLQLLQKSGAITQAGARLTTTITTPGANSSASSTVTPSTNTTSYIIQKDGSITATNTSKDASVLLPVTKQITETPMETETTSVNQSNIEQTQSTSQGIQTISTLPFSGSGVSSRESSFGSPQLVGQTTGTSQTETISSVGNEDISASTNTSQLQTSGRFIQLPNPSGTGMLTCMVGMKDGKIVLAPVDKSMQSKLGGQSILKINTPQSPNLSSQGIGQSLSASSAGSVVSQLQKQLMQAKASSPTVSGGTQFITIPSTSGNKRIQLITVPHGQADQLKTTTSQILNSNTTATISNQQVSSGETKGNNSHHLSSNLIIHGVKRAESDSIITSLSNTDVTSHGSPAVSLLKDVSIRLSTPNKKTSLLNSLTDQQKPQESFRYILPGSNTTHILHTGTSGVQTGLAQAGQIFTALSTSGTIIGGQLTPSPGRSSATETSTSDQELFRFDSDNSSQSTSLLTAKRRLSKELDTTEYIPLGGNRGRGRGARGKARPQPWNSETEITPPASSNMSTLADLRQIGAHVIQAESEVVDGIPVVSIPDYSSESSRQTEALSTAHDVPTGNKNINHDASNSSYGFEQRVATDGHPKAITDRTSVNNQSYELLTRSILDSDNTGQQFSMHKHSHSLLAGAKSDQLSTSSLLTSMLENTTSSLTRQAKIETLMQTEEAECSSTEHVTDSGFNLNPLAYSNDEAMKESIQGLIEKDKFKSSNVDCQDMSVDDSQVSAAERYRMPVELFQPDEDSPENPAKGDTEASLSPKHSLNCGDGDVLSEGKKYRQQNLDSVVENKCIDSLTSPRNDKKIKNVSGGDTITPVAEKLTSTLKSNELLRTQNKAQPVSSLSAEKASSSGVQGVRSSQRKGRGNLYKEFMLETREASRGDKSRARETPAKISTSISSLVKDSSKSQTLPRGCSIQNDESVDEPVSTLLRDDNKGSIQSNAAEGEKGTTTKKSGRNRRTSRGKNRGRRKKVETTSVIEDAFQPESEAPLDVDTTESFSTSVPEVVLSPKNENVQSSSAIEDTFSESWTESHADSQDHQMQETINKKHVLTTIDKCSELKDIEKEITVTPDIEKCIELVSESINETCLEKLNTNTEVCLDEQNTDTEVCLDGPNTDTEVCLEGPITDTEVCLEGPITDTEVCLEGPNTDTEVCLEGPNADIEVCLEGPNADTEVCLGGPNTDTEVCLEGPNTDTEVCLEGPNTDTEVCLEGPNADIEVCLEGPNADTEVCLEGPNTDTEVCLGGPNTDTEICPEGPNTDTGVCLDGLNTDTEVCLEEPNTDTEVCLEGSITDTEVCLNGPNTDAVVCLEGPITDTEVKQMSDNETCLDGQNTDTEVCLDGLNTDTEVCLDGLNTNTEVDQMPDNEISLERLRTETEVCQSDNETCTEKPYTSNLVLQQQPSSNETCSHEQHTEVCQSFSDNETGVERPITGLETSQSLSNEEHATELLLESNKMTDKTIEEAASEDHVHTTLPIARKPGRPRKRGRNSRENKTKNSDKTIVFSSVSVSDADLPKITPDEISEPPLKIKSLELLNLETKQSTDFKSSIPDSFSENDGSRLTEVLVASSTNNNEVILEEDREKGTSLISKETRRSKGRPRGRSSKRKTSLESVDNCGPKKEDDRVNYSSDLTTKIVPDSQVTLPGEILISSSEIDSQKPVLITSPTGSKDSNITQEMTDSLVKSSPDKWHDIASNSCQEEEAAAKRLTKHTGKRKGKRKSHVLESEEAIHTNPCDVESSVDTKFTKVVSTLESNFKQAKLKKLANGSIEKKVKKDRKKFDSSAEKQALKREQISPVHKDDYKTSVSSFSKKKSESLKKAKHRSMLAKNLAASFINERGSYKVDWTVVSSPEDLLYSGMLSRRRMTRHPSLETIQKSFNSTKSPTNKTDRNSMPSTCSQAVVVRRGPKRLLPFDKPNVIPLSVKDTNNACTGGSVVSSLSGEKIITGVVVTRKPTIDWGCTIDDDEELLGSVPEHELKTRQRRNRNQLMTQLYKKAGVFSATVKSPSQQKESATAEENRTITTSLVSKTGVFEATADLSTSQQEDCVTAIDNAKKEIPFSSFDSRAGVIVDIDDLQETNAESDKQTQSNINSVELIQPAKQNKSVSNEEICNPIDMSESMNISFAINGIETDMPSDLPQFPLFSDHVLATDNEPQTPNKTATSPYSVPSPTRRSGRTPIPSKRALESIEDTLPFLPLQKVKRTGSQSSDGTQGGYEAIQGKPSSS